MTGESTWGPILFVALVAATVAGWVAVERARDWMRANRRTLADMARRREVAGVREWDDRRAVPVEALRPGDRVAGRVVDGVRSNHDAGGWVEVTWAGLVAGIGYAPGTIVLLDPEDGDR